MSSVPMTPGPSGWPLEPDAESMRSMIREATERVVAHVATLPEQPASYAGGGEELTRSLVEPAPESGAPIGELLDLVVGRLAPESYNAAGPGYLAYIPGGGLFTSAVAEMVAAAINRYTGVWIAAPGLVQLESNVIRWFCDLAGFGPGSGGFLTSGSSLANFSAVVTARCERLGDDFGRGVVYASDQVHHSVLKAARLAGLSARQVRLLPSDAEFRLDPGALERAIAADRAAGLEPFLAVASAGTTNTGAVDDLAGVAAIARREGLWLHVDAAYGGFFLLTRRGRERMRGIAEADSIALDPHKGLFLPYGTGCLLARDQGALRRAHAAEADYMPALQESGERVDFCDISPELSRDYRGLRAWLPLKLHGLGAFRAALDEKLDLAEWAAGEVARIPGIEIVARPQLSVVAFRLAPPAAAADEIDRLNHELLARVNARQRVYLTGTRLGGGFAVRICVLSFRTHRDRVEHCLEDLRQAAEELSGSGATAGGGPSPRA